MADINYILTQVMDEKARERYLCFLDLYRISTSLSLRQLPFPDLIKPFIFISSISKTAKI